MSVPSYSAPIALLLRLKGWRLRALVTAVTVLAAVLIVLSTLSKYFGITLIPLLSCRTPDEVRRVAQVLAGD